MMTSYDAEAAVLRERAETEAAGGCHCAGCLAQILRVYPIEDGDYLLHELVARHGYPQDYEQRLLFNALVPFCHEAEGISPIYVD